MKDVTRQEYEDAINTIGQWDKQISKGLINDKTRISTWLGSVDLSSRVYYIIRSHSFEFDYIEDLVYESFMSKKGAGIKAWLEFQEVLNNSKI